MFVLFLTQVFCCIAIVFVAIVWFIVLWIRQVFSSPRRDKAGSPLPGPPRALTGHRARAVYGHTALFVDRAGEAALVFDKDQREIKWLPTFCSRPLGDCFAMFFWGQWRVVIQGPERSQFVLQSQELKESWPWSPPINLLGKSCLSFLEEEEADHLRRLIGRPLSHRQVLLYAPQFAQQAEKCLQEVCSGKFKKKQGENATGAPGFETDDSLHGGWATTGGSSVGGGYDLDDEIVGAVFKVKWEALRSYTFDLVAGPVLGFQPRQTEQSLPDEVDAESARGGNGNKKCGEEDEEMPTRETMMLYMERMKRGVDVIKTTFGPEWMYIWILNEYGRALNARMHLDKVMWRHVELVAARDKSVRHQQGHAYQDPTTQPIPLLTLRENMMRNKEGIFGDSHVKPEFATSRPRSRSMPHVACTLESGASSDDDAWYDSGTEELAKPRTDHQSPTREWRKSMQEQLAEELAKPRTDHQSPTREWRKSMQEQLVKLDSPARVSVNTRVASVDDSGLSYKRQGAAVGDSALHKPILQSKQVKGLAQKSGISVLTVLERLLKQHDIAGNGMSQVVASEVGMMLWMMLEVGNAWTAMALTLIAADAEALALVQQELDDQEQKFGYEELFSPHVLSRMKYLDALLFEAIRLCPASIGGMKKTTQTIEIKDAGVQIAKDTDIFFCQPTTMKFDIHAAHGKKPENLGRRYPCVELYVFNSLPKQARCHASW
jgi:hypothetical protein